MEAAVAGQELRGLVDVGLVEQDGIGRWTSYSLRAARELSEPVEPESDEDRIILYVREKGSITSRECQGLLGVQADRAHYLFKKLLRAGRLRAVGQGRWRKYLVP